MKGSMTNVERWFDRKFEFTFPVELYPNLLARLRGTPVRLEEMLRGAAPEVLRRQSDGKWSMQEHAGHLLDLEPLWLARVGDFVKGAEVLTAADLSNRKTNEANHNGRETSEIVRKFREARAELLERLDGIEEGAITRTILHPRLKQPMRLVDHLFFAAEHDDHHLAKMWELRRG